MIPSSSGSYHATRIEPLDCSYIELMHDHLATGGPLLWYILGNKIGRDLREVDKMLVGVFTSVYE